MGIARVMAVTLAEYGLDPEAIFHASGLTLDPQQAMDERVAAVAMQKVWRQVVVDTGDEAFGLKYAQNMHPAALQGLGFAWIASSTLYDAFRRLVRYYRIISSAGEVILHEEDGSARLWYKIPAPKGVAAPASLDAALAVFIQLCRFTKGMQFKPARVEMQRVAPKDPTPFTSFFQCPISYDCPENCLYFSLQELNAALPMASPELARVNDQIVIDYLKRYDKDNIVSQVRASIIECLPSGAPGQESIASAMNTSPRSLQRKLSEEGVSYKQLLEDVRKDLAQQYLKESGRSIGEVTFLLGFTEPSNFARSFKRWTGITPHEYREQ